MKTLILAITIFMGASPLWAQVMTYQGRLKENGIPVNTSKEFAFALCDETATCYSSPSGSQFFSVTNGLFRSTFTLPSVNLSSGTWSLRVAVSGANLTPQENLTFVPYSVLASSAASASGLHAYSGDGVTASTNVMVSGNITASDWGVTYSTFAAIQGTGKLEDHNAGIEDVRIGVAGSVVSASADPNDVMAGGNFETEVPSGKSAMMIGVRAAGRNTGGTAPSYMGVYVDALENTGTITDTYGVYISSLTQGTQTNRPFAVYSGDANARSYFAGNIGISTVPAYALAVSSASGDVMWVSSYAVHGLKFVGDGSGLTGVTGASGTDDTKVLKAGDTMTGQLTLAGSTLTVGGNAFSVGLSTLVVTAGHVGINWVNPTAPLYVNYLSGDANVAQFGANGIVISTGGALQTTGTGHGGVSGNSRGTGSVDLQTSRASASQVASGSYSVIAGGLSNSVSGTQAAVVGGTLNQASAQYAFVGGGYSNAAAGAISSVSGGSNNRAGQVYSSVSGGQYNVVSASNSAIGGGVYNTVAGTSAVVSGGENNSAAEMYSAVSGGGGNTASGRYSAVSGGGNNTASNLYTVVPGGLGNMASGQYSAVLGGQSNLASFNHASVGGGSGNAASYSYATVSGGEGNTASDTHAVVSGGQQNTAGGQYSVISGGSYNAAAGGLSAVSGGDGNSAYGSLSVVSGGNGNTAGGYAAMVPGGQTNTAKGSYSWAAGYKSSSTADGSFTWSDSEGTVVENSTANRTVFKNRGGFLVTGSTSTSMGGAIDRGVMITGNGMIGVSINFPEAAVDVVSTGTAQDQYAQIWRSGTGVVVGSMSATGSMAAVRFVGDGSGLTGVTGATGTDPNALPLAGGSMTGTLDMNGNFITGVSTITMQGGSIAIVPPGTGGGNNEYGISIGSNSYNSYAYGVSVGYSARSNYTSGVGIGPNANNNFSYGVGIGSYASNNFSYGVAIGGGSGSNHDYGVGIGAGTTNNYDYGVGIGAFAITNRQYATAVGAHSANNAPYSAALGAYTYAASSSVALGYMAKANAWNSVAIGSGTVNNSTGTASFGLLSVHTSSAVNAGYYQIDGSTVLAVLPAPSSIAVGPLAGAANTTGAYNVFVGRGAGSSNAAGTNNAMLGYGAGTVNTGSANTFLGSYAGNASTTGGSNIVIGYLQDTSAPGANSELNIGGVIFGRLGYKTIGISTRAPQAALDIVSTGTAHSEMAQIWRDSNGLIVGSMSVTGSMEAVRFVGDGSGLTGVTGATGTDATKVLKTGDTMTGQLTLENSSMTLSTAGTINFAADENGHVGINAYADSSSGLLISGSSVYEAGLKLTNATKIWAMGNDAGTLKFIKVDGATNTPFYITTDGDATFTGAVAAGSFSGDGSGLTSVSGTDSSKLPLAGGTMTGGLLVNGSSVAVLAPETADYSLAAGTGTIPSHLYVSTKGFVGIGTTNPVSRLHLAEDSPALFLQDTDSSGGSAVGIMAFRDSSGSGVFTLDHQGGAVRLINYISGEPISFLTNSGGGANTRMMLTSSGRLGIGTGAPADTLDVAGGVTATTMTVSGDTFTVGASTLVVTNGSVGVNWTTPEAALHVSGGAKILGTDATGYVLTAGTGVRPDLLAVSTGGFVRVGDFSAQAPSTDTALAVANVMPAGNAAAVALEARAHTDPFAAFTAASPDAVIAAANFETAVGGDDGLPSAIGLRTQVRREGGGSGTVGRAIGLWVDQMYTDGGAGTTGDTYGIFIASQTAPVSGLQTNQPYAIYSEGVNSRVYIAGNVGISTVPAYALAVSSASGDVMWVSSRAVHAAKFIATGNADETFVAAFGDNGIIVSTGGAIQTTGFGHGAVLPDARGNGAVDLQTGRYSGDEVASGKFSVLAGGDGNKASGLYGIVGGGQVNRAQNTYASVLGGGDNTASGYASTVGGGQGNLASGEGSFVAGQQNDAAGTDATVPGGTSNSAKGEYSFAAGYASSSTANGAFTWADSEGVRVENTVADSTLFKNRGGFLVTGSTNTEFGGTLDRGVLITGNGLIGVSTGVPAAAIDVVSTGTTVNEYAQVWRNSNGVAVASITATGKFTTQAAMPGDDLGDHNATMDLYLGGNNIYQVSTMTASGDITAARYQINGSTVLAVLPGSGSIGVGESAGKVNTGNTNSFFGAYSGLSNTGGVSNTFIGASAGRTNTTANYNTFVGSSAGYGTNKGGGNVFMGYGAGQSNSTGESNTFLGTASGLMNQAGSDNVVIGRDAGRGTALTTYSSSTVVGYGAGYSLAGNTGNILLGFRSGDSITNGSGNIVIGNDVDTDDPTDSDRLNIGNAIYGNLTTGEIGIGTSTPRARLDVIQSDTSESYSLRVSSSDESYHLVVTTNGWIGMNMETPQSMFHLGGGDTDSTGMIVEYVSDQTGPEDTGYLGFVRARGTYSGTQVLVDENDVLGVIGFLGYNWDTGGAAGPYTDAAYIQASVDGTPTLNSADMPGRLEFKTTPDGSGDPVTRMVIKNDGSIGISTGVPQARLDVLAAGVTDTDYAQIWRDATGIAKATVTATGKFIGDGSGLVNVAATSFSGTLAVANGGTGATSLSGMLKGNGTGAFTAMTGTANRIARWSNASTLASGSIYDTNTGKVGVNVIPLYVLDISTNNDTDSYVARFGENGVLISTGGAIHTAGKGYGNVTPLDRGLGAVDLQTLRNVDTQVASGDFSVISGGVYNVVSASNSVIGGGYGNQVTGISAVVAGGESNGVLDFYSAVGGGRSNAVVSSFSFVGGGEGNATYSFYSAIGGGYSNTVNSSYGTIAGGSGNTTNSAYAAIGGGMNNSAGEYGSVGGGYNNSANGVHSAIAGGWNNSVAIDDGFIGAGNMNVVNGSGGLIGGGEYNTTDAPLSVIAGGSTNKITFSGAIAAFIGGGAQNVSTGAYSTVGGGFMNTSSGAYSGALSGYQNVASSQSAAVAGGEMNLADHDHAFVGGGYNNRAQGLDSVIAGGMGNLNSAAGAVIAGGETNLIRPDAWRSFIGAGQFNDLGGKYSSIVGGSYNEVNPEATAAFIGGGANNISTGSYSTVGGGYMNVSSGSYSGVFTGFKNESGAEYSTVGGGRMNVATGTYGTVGGGEMNKAADEHAVVAGGYNNLASQWYATVGGGYTNRVFEYGGFIGGGSGNVIHNAGGFSVIAGGQDNIILDVSGDGAIGGGQANTVGDAYGAIGGGYANTAMNYASIAGGRGNLAKGMYSSIGGGYFNAAVAEGAMVPGGFWNTAKGQYSFAAGFKSSSTLNGTFTWADSEGAEYLQNTVVDQVMFKARGGFWVSTGTVYTDPALYVTATNKVGIGITAPIAKLDVRAATGNTVSAKAESGTFTDGAIYGWTTSNATAVKGVANGNGYAGRFEGKVFVTDDGVNPTIPAKLQVNGDLGLGDGTNTGNSPLVIWLAAYASVNANDIVMVYGNNQVQQPATDNNVSVIGVALENITAPNTGKIAVGGVALVNCNSGSAGNHAVSYGAVPGSVQGTLAPVSGASIGVFLETCGATTAGKALVLLK